MMMQLVNFGLWSLLLLSPELVVDAKHVRQKASFKTPAGSRVRGIHKKDRELQADQDIVGDEGIIGGVNAALGEFPFYVKFEGGTLCGGSLISPDTVLTAAHCVDQGAPGQVRVGPTEYYGGQAVDTICSVSHPDFIENSETLMNDVAIIKLATPVDTSVIPFNRNTSYPEAAGTPLNVIGFGVTENEGNVANVLQKLTTNFVSMSNCQESYSTSIVTAENHICADISDAGDCNGDSGGPVFDDAGLQVGIVSFGYGGCASDAYQDVYVNIASYSSWIMNYAEGSNCQPANTGDDGGADADNGGNDKDDEKENNGDNDKDDNGGDDKDGEKEDNQDGGDEDEGDTTEDDDEEDFDWLGCLTTVWELVQGVLGNGEGGGKRS